MSSSTDLALAGNRLPARAERPKPPAIRPELMPSPIEKAAMILTAIGPELAAGFLRELAEPDMQRFARAISGLGKINQEVLDAVIVEFLELLTTGPEIAGGSKAARKLLAAVLDDEDEVQRLLDGRQRSEVRSVWERLNDTPVPSLATFLQAEHPADRGGRALRTAPGDRRERARAAGPRLRPDDRRCASRGFPSSTRRSRPRSRARSSATSSRSCSATSRSAARPT